jgi:hypothetical protein
MTLGITIPTWLGTRLLNGGIKGKFGAPMTAIDAWFPEPRWAILSWQDGF